MQVTFHADDRLHDVLNAVGDSKLTGWMKYLRNHQDDERAMDITYADFPEYYTWVPPVKTGARARDGYWKKRGNMSRDPTKKNTIGRIYYQHPTDKEPYCLRLLLHKLKVSTKSEIR